MKPWKRELYVSCKRKRAWSFRRMTVDRLFGWHNCLFPYGKNGYEEIDVGKYRVDEMNVISGALGREKVHYHAPAPERVPEK